MNDEFLLALAEISSTQSSDFSEYIDRVRQLVEASVAPETRCAYSSRLRRFINWCDVKGYGTTKKKHDAATVEIVRYLLNAISEDNSPKNIRDRLIISLGLPDHFDVRSCVS